MEYQIIEIQSSDGLTAGQGSLLIANNNSNAYIAFSAEL